MAKDRVGKQKSRKGRSILHHEPIYDPQSNTIRAPKVRKYEQGALDERAECRVFLEEVMAHGARRGLQRAGIPKARVNYWNQVLFNKRTPISTNKRQRTNDHKMRRTALHQIREALKHVITYGLRKTVGEADTIYDADDVPDEEAAPEIEDEGTPEDVQNKMEIDDNNGVYENISQLTKALDKYLALMGADDDMDDVQQQYQQHEESHPQAYHQAQQKAKRQQDELQAQQQAATQSTWQQQQATTYSAH